MDQAWELALAGLFRDVGDALHSGQSALPRALSDAAWSLATARDYRARGYTEGARAALARARGLYAEAESLAPGNAVGSMASPAGPQDRGAPTLGLYLEWRARLAA